MAQHLYAIHDANRDWAYLLREANVTGYAIVSEGIGDDPTNFAGMDYSWLLPYGVTPIVRLNYSHGRGTIPLPTRYVPFSIRCANFVSASSGCRHYIIGNEPNWSIEQPDGVPITPQQYAECFRLCRHQIKQRSVTYQVIPAAIAPYNEESGWCIDYWRQMLGIIATSDGSPGADALALHTYSRGGDPNSIYSDAKMEAYPDCYNGFRAYRDFLGAVPAVMRGLPVYVTETDQIDPWVDANSGWVKNAYDEINDWNGTVGNQTIHCLALYRWENYDRWVISGKNGVIDDFKEALWVGYTVPDSGIIPPEPPEPGPEPPVEPPQPTPERDIDAELIERGVTVTEATASPHWHLAVANFLDEDESGGRHHIYIETVDADYRPVAGVNFLAVGQGSETSGVTNDKLGFDAANVPMWASEGKNGYTVYLDNGDTVAGLGMGDETAQGWNSGIHTSTVLTYQFLAPEVEPSPIHPHTEYVLPIVGAWLRDEPGPHGEEVYAVPFREAVSVSGLAEDPAGDLWASVRYHEYDGFIRSDLLSLVQHDAIMEPPPADDLILIWPMRKGIVTQWFNDRSIDYSRWGIDSHDGIDIAAATGTPVYAVCHGKVVAVGDDPEGFGLFVRVYHEAHGFHSLYGHLSRQLVSVGELVTRGKAIGEVGTSGNSSGPHLHLSFRVGSEHDYWRVHTGHKQGASDPMAIYAVINRSDPNRLIP